jgi:hypothetical protein
MTLPRRLRIQLNSTWKCPHCPLVQMLLNCEFYESQYLVEATQTWALWHSCGAQYCIVMGIHRARGSSLSQVPSQNLVRSPLSTTNDPRSIKKSSFTFTNPFLKGESFGFSVTWARVLDCKYLLCRSSCQTTSSLNSLNSHLLSKLLFFNYKTSIPKPTWSLGRQIIFHLVSLYFFLCSSLCQKNREQ